MPPIVLLLAAALAAETPRLLEGTTPTPPIEAVGGGEVLLEVAVGPAGGVTEVRTLRSTPPFTDALRMTVSGWTFERRAGRVLVAGLYRSPTLVGPTFGELPANGAVPSESVPFPENLSAPAYPATATGDAAVVLELNVDAGGAVTVGRTVQSAGIFDGAAIEAVRSWRFRPARVGGVPRPSLVYAVLGFRAPVVAPPPQPPPPPPPPGR
jgi:TonB family protein